MASWVNKLVSKFLVWRSTRSMKITEGLVKYITVSQKIHLALLNFVAVDIAFIGTRTLTHLNITASNMFLLIWTMVVYVLLILDLLEMGFMQSNLKFKTFKQLRAEKIIIDPIELE